MDGKKLVFGRFGRFLGGPEKCHFPENGVQISSAFDGRKMAFLAKIDETGLFWQKVDFRAFLGFFGSFWAFRGFWEKQGLEVFWVFVLDLLDSLGWITFILCNEMDVKLCLIGLMGFERKRGVL